MYHRRHEEKDDQIIKTESTAHQNISQYSNDSDDSQLGAEENRSELSHSNDDQFISEESRSELSHSNDDQLIAEESRSELSHSNDDQFISEESRSELSHSNDDQFIAEENGKHIDEEQLRHHMAQIVQHIQDKINVRGGYFDFDFWHRRRNDKERYINTAYDDFITSINNDAFNITVKKFKVYLICCMQNKNGNGFLNFKTTKTGNEALAFLNMDFNNLNAKNELLSLIMGNNKEISKISYKQLAHQLATDRDAAISAKNLIFNKSKDNLSWHPKKEKLTIDRIQIPSTNLQK
jgi:hypothetical protein